LQGKTVSNRNSRLDFGKGADRRAARVAGTSSPVQQRAQNERVPDKDSRGNVVCRGTRAAMIRPLIGDEHRWFANKTQRSGRWRSSTTSISPRATFPRSAPKSACSSVMLIRFSEPGMKLLAYAASLFFSSI
jgi:hypothetical protein